MRSAFFIEWSCSECILICGGIPQRVNQKNQGNKANSNADCSGSSKKKIVCQKSYLTKRRLTWICKSRYCSIKKSCHNYMISGYNEGILENGTVSQKRKIQKIKVVEIQAFLFIKYFKILVKIIAIQEKRVKMLLEESVSCTFILN